MMFEFAPIETFLRRRGITTYVDMAAALHVGTTTLDRYRTRGMSAAVVDKLCQTRLGAHPLEVYPDFCSYRRIVGEHLAARRTAA